MDGIEIRSQLTIADVLRRWPAAAAAFVRRGMTCPGCTMARFETADEAAGVFRVDADALAADLAAAASAEPAPDPDDIDAVDTSTLGRGRS